MNTEEQRKWNNEDMWENDGHEWSAYFGTSEKMWESFVFPRVSSFLKGTVLEIAPGYGRMTEFLLNHVDDLTIVDMNEKCIARCKERFGEKVKCFVNDGTSLEMIEDNSIDFVFSWDSFVHMDKDVISYYAKEISRVLKKGGVAVIHHSYFWGNDEPFRNVAGRSTMSPGIFEEIVNEYDMSIIDQEIFGTTEIKEGEFFDKFGVWVLEDTISTFGMRKDRKFYHLDNSRKIVHTDLEKEYAGKPSTKESYKYMYHEMFHCREFTDSGCDYERKGCHIVPGDVVIDVGGNIGVFARRAWEQGAKRVLSFEPQRIAFDCNLKNAKKGVEVFNLAISDKFEKVMIGYDFDGVEMTGGGSMFAHLRGKEGNVVEEAVLAVTLDSLFECEILPEKVDFLKVDVEGAELAVFNGISDDNLKKFRSIAFEAHRTVLSDEQIESIVSRIDKLGYKHFSMHYTDLTLYNFWKI